MSYWKLYFTGEHALKDMSCGSTCFTGGHVLLYQIFDCKTLGF